MVIRMCCQHDHKQYINVCHAGSSSPSVSSGKPIGLGDLQRNQSLGQRIMGNRFLRSFTSKPKDQEPDISVQSRMQVICIDFFLSFKKAKKHRISSAGTNLHFMWHTIFV